MANQPEFCKVFTGGREENNVYILHDGDDTVIIDPCEDHDDMFDYLKQINCSKLRILLTHGHEDHISAIPDLMKQYPGSPILIHHGDIDFLTNPQLNGSYDQKEPLNLKEFSSHFQETDPTQPITIGQFSLEVFPTPGHTQGSVLFIDHAHKTVYTGDTLFQGTIGATHFPGGNKKQMFDSLIKIHNTIPDDYAIYPGHSELTTMEKEKKSNPYLQW